MSQLSLTQVGRKNQMDCSTFDLALGPKLLSGRVMEQGFYHDLSRFSNQWIGYWCLSVMISLCVFDVKTDGANILSEEHRPLRVHSSKRPVLALTWDRGRAREPSWFRFPRAFPSLGAPETRLVSCSFGLSP